MLIELLFLCRHCLVRYAHQPVVMLCWGVDLFLVGWVKQQFTCTYNTSCNLQLERQLSIIECLSSFPGTNCCFDQFSVSASAELTFAMIRLPSAWILSVRSESSEPSDELSKGF